MRVGVIRGDLPGPVFLADLEPTSQHNNPVDPVAQTRYVSRPNATAITNFLAGVYASDTEDGSPAVTLPIPAGKTGAGGVTAGIEGTALTFPLTISGGSNVLRVKNTSAGSFTVLTITPGSFATMALLVAAINALAKTAAVGVTATTDTATGTLLVLQSTVPGVGSYIGLDTNGNGSTANATLGFSTSGANFTMPSATTIITAMNPVASPPATGSINVSAATILSTLGAAPAAAHVADLIAPQFQESEVAIQSFQVGNLAGYLLASFNPDPHRVPAITAGPAIQVVQNDGHTAFTAALPMITAAVHNSPATGDITITGVGLGTTEFPNDTVVLVTAASSTTGTGAPKFVKLTQKQITSVIADGVAMTGTYNVTQGSASVPTSTSQSGLILPGNSIVFASQPKVVYDVSTVTTTTVTLTAPYTGPTTLYTTAKVPVTQGVVSPTSIVIPADLLTPTGGVALGVVGSTVEVKNQSFANTNYGTAATISSITGGVVTLTGLAHQVATQVGSYITISGAATAANNGTFKILSYVSATSITIANINGVAGDANNGSIIWSEPPPVAFVVT